MLEDCDPRLKNRIQMFDTSSGTTYAAIAIRTTGKNKHLII